MEPLRVGMLGLGTVGGGVARLLSGEGERIARRAGRPIQLTTIVVRDPKRPRAIAPPPGTRLTDDPRAVLDNPELDVVVEVAGGIEPARGWMMAALRNGKDVVTANKALLAEHGADLMAEAGRTGRALAFEASVGGGVPVIHALTVALTANRVDALAAILNGTCNSILTEMTESGRSYRDALALAQAQGFAEADPTLDVDGTDTAHKLAILAWLAFDHRIGPASIPRRGIDTLDELDLRFAAELGYAVKLLAWAERREGTVAPRVAPTLVKRGTPLAEIRGPFNAIRIVGDAVGEVVLTGQGAGASPTASAVVGDLIDVATGRARLTTRFLASPPSAVPSRTASAQVVDAAIQDPRRRHYLRFGILDQPGVLGRIALILGQHGISIASVIQHDPGEKLPEDSGEVVVPLVVMTHLARESALERALEQIDRLDCVRAPSLQLPVLD
ncbi:homoserine dehydrogenase [Isosphaera pallida ATCC 43644]|jgi:homoserine dehydrogenase|uniref:Homoserine dehydrogenase n=1 Tax=Isosphaera pallida (strain ATCC 43644 / DSM 9630 / IS1B) TaxID=575540 RepID=E8R168_ISOPI|nr:homoserine dehydrogenase [Isosphaera pallida]ADV61274.1 homoserine dehydrogenase [Isosphaera pallida ATCC 43644]